MSSYGMVHLITAFMAIAAGAVVLRPPKGTRWHRTFGHLYAMSMLGVITTSFAIYGLTGSPGPFHFAAVVAAVALGGGMITVLFRRPRKGWIEAHAIWMSWSYIGLMAAFAAESLTRFVMPRAASYLESSDLWTAFWIAVGVASFLVIGVGWWITKTILPGVIERTPHAMREERRSLREAEADPTG